MAEATIPASKFKSEAASAELATLSRFKYSAEPRFFLMLLLGLLIYFISASIGSGWALFLASGLFCCCALAVALPVLALRALSVELVAPEQVGAGDRFPVSVRIRSAKVLAPLSRMLILRMVPESGVLYDVDNGETALAEALERNKVFALALTAPALRRGIRPLIPFTVETSFPMGMLWCSAYFQSPKSLAVLPRVESVEGKFLYRLRSGVYVPGDAQGTNSGFQSCTSKGVRVYNRGDSRRFIHWAASARHGRLMVRELEQEGLPAYDVVFDAAADWQSKEQFELALSAVASVLELGHSSGIHPDLFLLDHIVKAGDQLGPRSADIDQQLLALAALEYKKPEKKSSEGVTDPGAFSSRTRAVVFITPMISEIEQAANSGENSRSSVFVLKVSALTEPSAKPPANTNEFILCKKEELRDL